jgi:hypothetical protein
MKADEAPQLLAQCPLRTENVGPGRLNPAAVHGGYTTGLAPRLEPPRRRSWNPDN